jgi:dTDP-4-amino-4,6-dideoxygalactose transaminase
MSEFLPFAKPCFDQATLDEVMDCLNSGWIATGPRTKKFEDMLQAYTQAPHSLALTSGTAGLHLALMHLKLQPGDEVITTPMTFIATLNMIELTGGRTVMVDIEKDTYNIDVDNIAKAITPKTRAIVPVHFTGVPVDLDPIYDLAKKHNLRVIEDAAHAIGSSYKGRRIGSFGDTQMFSFHPNKIITSGEGGLITTRDDAMAQEIKVLRFHGIDRDAFNRFSKSGSQTYDVKQPGFKYNMLDIQAAIGIHQVQRLEEFKAKRKVLAERYMEAFKDWPELILPEAPNYEFETTYYMFAPLINTEVAGITREEFMQKMKEYDIGTGLHYEAAHLYTYYREKYGYDRGSFPRAEYVGDRIVSLPLFPQMTESEQQRVIDAMAKVFKK